MWTAWRRALSSMRQVVCLAATITAIGVLAAPPARPATWDHVHADATGSGFVGVTTLPALRPMATVPGIGTYAPGAGPVIGPDGTVYLGNEQGELRALHPDGSLYWMRTLNPLGQGILASPVVDTDGSIYVIGVRSYTDHRVTPAVRRSESRLYRFSPTGALVWVTLFPEHFFLVPANADNGAGMASPNIWRQGQDMAIMVPAVYPGPFGEVRLLAFTNAGRLIADRSVGSNSGQIIGTGGRPPITFCPVEAPPDDPADRLPSGIAAPFPTVAIYTYPGGGTPWIIATDTQRFVVGLTFSMTSGFTGWWFRDWWEGIPDGRIVTLAAPMVMPDAHSVVGTAEWQYDSECDVFRKSGGHVTFGGPNANPLADVPLDYDGTFAPAARTADGRIIVTHEFGFDVLRGSTRLEEVFYPGDTIAPAAVSRSHIYISTAGSFRTYDANTLAKVGEVDWFGGGLSGPAIGPSGRVYALASNILFIWPGPVCPRTVCIPIPPVGGVFNARRFGVPRSSVGVGRTGDAVGGHSRRAFGRTRQE